MVFRGYGREGCKMTIREFFGKVLELCGLRRKVAVDVAPLPAVEALSETAPVKEKRKREKRETYGNFYYFDNLLDQIESYFYYVKRMKAHDAEAYELYENIGGHIVNDTAGLSCHELPAAWRHGYRPSFGLVHYAGDKWDDDEGWVPKLLYFTKCRWAYNVQGVNAPGDIYHCSFFYAKKGKRVAIPAEVYIHLTPEGCITPLKIRSQEQISIKSKRGFATVSRLKYTYPSFVFHFAKEHQKSPPEAIADLFKFMVGLGECAADGIQVLVSKDNIKCAFNVATERTPYFFKDRQKTCTERGFTKPILHVVKPHMRTLPNGKQVAVKMQFRGERKFTWKGYAVSVSMAGFHHRDMIEVDVAAEMHESLDGIKGAVTAAEFAKQIAPMMGRVH